MSSNRLENLSLIIITKNEEQNIRKCIESVPFAGEIVVVDSGSSDKTLEIVREIRPDAVIEINEDWQGFGFQKNLALSLASKEWVLSLDADEWLSEKLAEKIKQICSCEKTSNISGYSFNRRNLFMGRKLRSFNYWPDRVLRLCKRESATFSDDLVHESLQCKGRKAEVKLELMHHICDSLTEFISRNYKYLEIWVEQKLKEGKKSSYFKMLLSPIYRFCRDYFVRLGFLDGTLGLTLCWTSAYLTYMKYSLLKIESKNSKN